MPDKNTALPISRIGLSGLLIAKYGTETIIQIKKEKPSKMAG